MCAVAAGVRLKMDPGLPQTDGAADCCTSDDGVTEGDASHRASAERKPQKGDVSALVESFPSLGHAVLDRAPPQTLSVSELFVRISSIALMSYT